MPGVQVRLTQAIPGLPGGPPTAWSGSTANVAYVRQYQVGIVLDFDGTGHEVPLPTLEIAGSQQLRAGAPVALQRDLDSGRAVILRANTRGIILYAPRTAEESNFVAADALVAFEDGSTHIVRLDLLRRMDGSDAWDPVAPGSPSRGAAAA